MAPNACVSFDADLMTQTMPCSVFSNSAVSFSAVSGGQSKPILFSVSDDGHLYLLHTDNSTGKKPLINLNDCFHIPAGATVTTHAVTQDQNGNIYLSFATCTAGPNPAATVYVVQPTTPSTWTSVSAGRDLTSWLFTGGSSFPKLIKQIYMSNELDNTGYPLLAISYTDLDGNNLSACQIVITLKSKTWSLDNDNELDLSFNHEPQNPKFFNGGPATAIATVTNRDGYPDLLVSLPGSLIQYHVRYQEDKLIWTTTNLRIDSFAASKELRVAQTDHISVWAENGSNDISYQKFDLTMSQQLTPVVPLLKREQGGGAFAVYLDPITGSQNLFTVDDKSQLTRLVQDPTTHLWQHLPILVPSLDVNEDFTSFTSHINVADSNGNALAASPVLLCSSSSTDLAVNGESLTVGPEGVEVKTDRRTGNPSVLGQPYTLNPAKKIQEELAKVTDAASLKSITLPDGSKLLDGSTASPEAISNAGLAIGQLHQHMQSLPHNGSLQSASRNRVSTKNAPVDASDDDSTLWDFWHWFTHEVESIENWAVKVVDETAHWVITIGEKSYSFLLDCVTHVLKAVGWVLQQVVTDIEKIIQWVGFIFQWDDILSTHKSFVDVTNKVFALAPAAFNEMENSVEEWFDKIKDTLHDFNAKDPNLTKSYDPTSASQITANTGPTNAAINTPGFNWSYYQLEHGGVGESLANANMSVSGKSDADNPFSGFWEDIIEPTYKTLETDLSTLLKDLASSINDSKPFSLANVVTGCIDFAVLILDALKDIIKGFLKLTDMVISTMGDMISTSLNIPFLSPLYKTKTGSDLTILDAISLLMAIPTTIICKILTGKTPSQLPVTSMPKNGDTMSLGSARSLYNTLNEGTSGGLMDEFTTITTLIRPYVPFASLAINKMILSYSLINWSDPTSSGAVNTIMTSIAWICAFPDVNAIRPGLESRMIDWVLGIVLIIGNLLPEAHARGAVGLYVAIIQLLPISVSIVLDSTVPDDKYPQRTVGGVTANSIDRIANQIAKMFSNGCLITQDTAEVQLAFIAAATITGAIKYATQVVKVVIPETECAGLHGY
ncbi:MAG: hypothetical protein J3R72DRAFT_525469 [Linnemannia gamsii]|nr:MAG: hypothetical protein J3R72DRAFT_525469 [Linnemannia gamsii]